MRGGGEATEEREMNGEDRGGERRESKGRREATEERREEKMEEERREESRLKHHSNTRPFKVLPKGIQRKDIKRTIIKR